MVVAHVRIVGLLARARLEARQRGFDLRFTGGSEQLRELVRFCGLEDVLFGEDVAALVDAAGGADADGR